MVSRMTRRVTETRRDNRIPFDTVPHIPSANEIFHMPPPSDWKVSDRRNGYFQNYRRQISIPTWDGRLIGLFQHSSWSCYAVASSYLMLMVVVLSVLQFPFVARMIMAETEEEEGCYYCCCCYKFHQYNTFGKVRECGHVFPASNTSVVGVTLSRPRFPRSRHRYHPDHDN